MPQLMSPPCGAWHPPCPRAALLPSRERGVGSLSAPIPLFRDTTCLHCRGGFCWYPTPAANPSPGTAGAHCLLLEHPSSPRDCQLWGTHPIGKPAGAGTCPGRPGKETLGLFCKSSWDGSQGAGGEPCSHTQPRSCLCEHPGHEHLGHARLGGAAGLFWELSAPPREVSDAFIYKLTGFCPAPASSHAGKSPTEPRQTEPAASPHGRT